MLNKAIQNEIKPALFFFVIWDDGKVKDSVSLFIIIPFTTCI